MAERSEAVEEQAVRDASAAYKVAADIATTEDVPPGYKRTEAGVIPEDWEVTELKEVADFANGKPRESNVSPYGRFSLITLDSVGIDGKLKTEHKKIAFYDGSLSKGDIVVILSDIAHGNLLGLCDVIPEDNKYVLNQRVGRLRLSPTVDSQYIRLQINKNQYHFKNRGQGSSQRHIYKRDFESLLLPIPSLGEQRSIATALSDADAMIESLDRLIAKKRAIKQAAMQQLLTGQTRLPSFSGEWETKRLGEVVEIRSGGTPSTAMPALWNGGVPWCTPTDITALHGRKYLSETERTISHAGLQASSAESIPPQSIIMTTRATIGECAINTVPMTTNQGFKNLVPLSANTEFLYYLMTTKKGELIQLCGGSTFLEIGKKQLNGFEVMLPQNREEQEAIATVLSDMDTEIEALERRRDKARQIKQGMMQQLLTGRVRLVAPQTTEPVAC